uniref:Uncharacterized protein n=1 Tax=Lotus japonicus TaxID=34305 RepID=I3SAW0_LOTJA|nr:unknown [Lotus japonicus]
MLGPTQVFPILLHTKLFSAANCSTFITWI